MAAMNVKPSTQLHGKAVCAAHQKGISNVDADVLGSTDERDNNERRINERQHMNQYTHITDGLTP
jgi:hypothetical protein